jgi:hypothetical protein
MGFLRKTFGKGDTTLAISVEADRVPAGGEVVIRWDVGGELDEKVRGLRAGVTATGYWEQRGEDTFDRDHDGRRNDLERHGTERKSYEVWASTRDFPAQLGSGEARIPLPDDAPPGSSKVLKWTAWVAVDREKGRDHVEEVTLYVRRPAVETEPVQLSEDGITVTGIPLNLRLGARYPGTVSLTVPDEVKGAVKVVLERRVRFISDHYRGDLLTGVPELLGMPKLPGTDLLQRAGVSDEHVLTRTTEELELTLTDKQAFAPGQTHELPFELEVPKKGPTTAHDHAQVDWRLVVKLDRKLRGDLRVAAPVDVS